MKKITLALGTWMVLAGSAQAGPACEYLRNYVALQPQTGDELRTMVGRLLVNAAGL